jgi:hypothetical protein
MKTADKIKIVNALVEIKLALGEYNSILLNGPQCRDEDYNQLELAFNSVKDITEIIKSA